MLSRKIRIEAVIAKISGNLKGLKKNQIKTLERTYRRKVPDCDIVTNELAKHLTAISADINRQVGVLIDRRGLIYEVIVGETSGLHIPTLSRIKKCTSRFNGLRLVHTHLKGEKLSQDDLTDLALLRLDMVCAITIKSALPDKIYVAHLLPHNPENERFAYINASSIGQLDFDFLETITEVEQEFEKMAGIGVAGRGDRRALLVGVSFKKSGSNKHQMDELFKLAKSAGLLVAKSYLQSRFKPDTRTLIGSGKLRELVLDSMQLGADIIIFDNTLSPAQVKAISKEVDVEVLDRNQLILAIFGQRAKSQAGKMQVELASLKYELPRLHTKFEGLSRISGGIGALGPGETKLEIHKRKIRDKISLLERGINKLSSQRSLRRSRRDESGVPVVAIVGYTNTGKSTLLNRITKSKIKVKNQLFATLDPTSRNIKLSHEHEFVMTDTVGFIRDLPEDLTSAFRATLEELADADLLLHVIDISNPNYELQIEAVENIIEQLKLQDIPILAVYNKCDKLIDSGIEIMQNEAVQDNSTIAISAKTGLNIDKLLKAITHRLFNLHNAD